MADFETHPRGTHAELKAARNLVQEIEQTIKQYSEGVIPGNILQAHKLLVKIYEGQLEKEYPKSEDTKCGKSK